MCGKNKAKYTCPKCEVKTCCLDCVRIHKKELECDGTRDRTKFIRIKDFTDTDLLSDYRLLEECARFVYGVKIDEKKKYTRIDKDLPIVSICMIYLQNVFTIQWERNAFAKK